MVVELLLALILLAKAGGLPAVPPVRRQLGDYLAVYFRPEDQLVPVRLLQAQGLVLVDDETDCATSACLIQNHAR